MVLIGLVAACGLPTTGQMQATTSPASSASTTSPSPAPSFPVGAVTFTCRLPVMTIDMSATMTGGFVGFPSGNYSADPGATFKGDQQSDGTFRWHSTKQPQLSGSFAGLFYDQALSRWIPSAREAVYPDGTRYAYVTSTPNQTVHIVDVATGHERVLPAPHPLRAWVYDYSPGGIYLAAQDDAGQTGLWLLDPQKGTERLLTSEKIVAAVGNGKVWLSQLTNPRSGSVYADTLVELNLTTGAKRVWFHQDNSIVGLMGLTTGVLPVVSIAGKGISLLHSPGVAERIYSGSSSFVFLGDDRYGMWFSSNDGIFLYARETGLRRVAPAVIGVRTSAGTCA